MTTTLLGIRIRYVTRIKSGEKFLEFRRCYVAEASQAYLYLDNEEDCRVVGRRCGEVVARLQCGVPRRFDAETLAKIAERQTIGAGKRLVQYLGTDTSGSAIPILRLAMLEPFNVTPLVTAHSLTTWPLSFLVANEYPGLVAELEIRSRVTEEVAVPQLFSLDEF